MLATLAAVILIVGQTALALTRHFREPKRTAIILRRPGLWKRSRPSRKPESTPVKPSSFSLTDHGIPQWHEDKFIAEQSAGGRAEHGGKKYKRRRSLSQALDATSFFASFRSAAALCHAVVNRSALTNEKSCRTLSFPVSSIQISYTAWCSCQIVSHGNARVGLICRRYNCSLE